MVRRKGPCNLQKEPHGGDREALAERRNQRSRTAATVRSLLATEPKDRRASREDAGLEAAQLAVGHEGRALAERRNQTNWQSLQLS